MNIDLKKKMKISEILIQGTLKKFTKYIHNKN